MNYRRELRRYNLLVGKGLSPERIEELIPEYPENAPTILSSNDININFTRNFAENSKDVEKKRLLNERHDPTPSKRVFFQPFISHFFKKSTKGATFESLIWDFPEFVKSGVLETNLEAFLGDTMRGHVRASNNWVVSGSKTDSGFPYLANDPHLGFTVPSIWLMMHLENKGEGKEIFIIGNALL
jgi:acyl-homoserine lactone acylase PvdQ